MAAASAQAAAMPRSHYRVCMVRSHLTSFSALLPVSAIRALEESLTLSQDMCVPQENLEHKIALSDPHAMEVLGPFMTPFADLERGSPNIIRPYLHSFRMSFALWWPSSKTGASFTTSPPPLRCPETCMRGLFELVISYGVACTNTTSVSTPRVC